MSSTRDKIEFALLLGRHSSATASDCLRLLRFASTLKRLAEREGEGEDEQPAKKIRVQRKVMALCAALNREVFFERSGAVRVGEIQVPA